MAISSLLWHRHQRLDSRPETTVRSSTYFRRKVSNGNGREFARCVAHRGAAERGVISQRRGRSCEMCDRHVIRRCMLVASIVVGLNGEAQAISTAKLLRAEVMILDEGSPNGWRQVGRLRTLVVKFRKAGHRCIVSTYEYGGALTCRTRAGRLTREGQHVIVDLRTAGRFNETELEGEIRPDGVKSRVLQGPDALRFLNAL